jgi:hypothetical protein
MVGHVNQKYLKYLFLLVKTFHQYQMCSMFLRVLDVIFLVLLVLVLIVVLLVLVLIVVFLVLVLIVVLVPRRVWFNLRPVKTF